ncbi:bacteriohemerythrin [Desulforhopalus sp. 52FAK]
MGRIDWNDSFSVHHKEIDRQHKKLIDLYNELHETLLHGTIEESTEKRQQTLNSLVEYIDYHFSFEEEYLEELNYALLEKHCQSHKNFSSKVKTLQQDILSGNMVFTSSLIKLLRNWIVDHILKEDKAYSVVTKP